MICWSCEKQAGRDLLCVACGAVQPADPTRDRFAVLGIEPAFDVDLADLERRYKDLTKVLHPDRYARADARARRASLERSVQLNEAWRTLRDPVRRAEYLLRLAGVEVAGETSRAPAPPALLMEVMELREGLAAARAAGDHGRVEALAGDVRGRRSRAMDTVAEALRGRTPDNASAAAALVTVRYYDRFLEEVAIHEERRAEAGHG